MTTIFSAIRRRLHVSPAAVIATLALVFAITGGAYAAKKYLITSTKQISPSVLKSLQGKAGSAGPAGANGAQGQAGPAGPQGPVGAKGENGAPGKDGAPGKNGENGKDGTTGFTETLPAGKTLKGDWGVMTTVQASGPEGVVSSFVSFGIPLAEAPVPHLIPAPTEEELTKGEFPAPPSGCTGNFERPGAEKGNLCVFASEERNVLVTLKKVCATTSATEAPLACLFGGGATPESDDPYGFGVFQAAAAKGLVGVAGTWAVTAK
jgi:Collagen triple helix repeat (20 copies)